MGCVLVKVFKLGGATTGKFKGETSASGSRIVVAEVSRMS